MQHQDRVDNRIHSPMMSNTDGIVFVNLSPNFANSMDFCTCQEQAALSRPMYSEALVLQSSKRDLE